ncbi:MAG TPA: hypothetical protein VFV63_01215 [Ilumatobacteraceae bacterium]|nr:hypothetical protein [Ilumatobacteraceae bacterium]
MQRTTRTTRLVRLLPLSLPLLVAAALFGCGGDDGALRDVASLGTTVDDTADDTGDTTGDGDDTTDDTVGDDADVSGGDTSDDAPDEAEVQDAQVRFTRCMREHGVDMPDPTGDGGVMIQIDEGTDQSEIQEAEEACRPILEEIIGSFEPPSAEETEQMREQMLEFTRCMREHGIDMPDPEFGENGTFTVGAGPGAAPGDDAGSGPDQDEFEAAAEACGFGPGGEGGAVFSSGGRVEGD